MGTRIIKMPDVGEGVAEAEIVEWHVEVGQSVLEDQILAAVMTDKATVEIPSPVAGKVLALGGEVGSTLAVGAELVRLEVAGEGNDEVAAAPREAAPPAHPPAERLTTPPPAPKAPAPTPVEAATPVARGIAGTAAAARREADRLARGAAARARGRHRPAPGARQRPGRPHQPRRPRRLPEERAAGGGDRRRPRRAHRGRDRQGHRPAPAHRPEDGRVQAPRRALLLRRGGRRHRARGAARQAQRREPGPAAADLDAVPDAGAGARGRRLPRDERALRRRGRDHRAPCRRAYRHRHADAAGPDGAGGAPLRGARPVGLRRRGAAAGRGGAQRPGDARRAFGLDHHHHQPGPARRHRHHAGASTGRRWRSSASTGRSCVRCGRARSSCRAP